MRPSLSVVQTAPSRRRKLAPALSSPPKQQVAVKQAGREPFEADRHLPKLATKAGNHPIDETAAHERFADDGALRPLRADFEEIADGDGEVMVRVQQAGGRSDDAMPVSIGIVGEGDVEAILEFDQPGHRPGAGAIHADFAVMINRHERESRIDFRVHDRKIEAVAFGRSAPNKPRPRRRADRRRSSRRHSGWLP